MPSREALRLGLSISVSQIISAASSGDSVGKALYMSVGAIIGVRTSGMYTVENFTLSPTHSGATQRENASSAAFEAT